MVPRLLSSPLPITPIHTTRSRSRSLTWSFWMHRSKARLQAWKQRHRNANSYYYRFTGTPYSSVLLCSLRLAFGAAANVRLFCRPDGRAVGAKALAGGAPGVHATLRGVSTQRLASGYLLGPLQHGATFAVHSSLHILSLALFFFFGKKRVKMLTCVVCVCGTCVVVIIICVSCVAHRVGYQCANHYRKLLKEGKLNDNSFKLDPKGEVKLVEGADTRGHVHDHLRPQPQESALANPADVLRVQCGIENALSDVWKTKEVKAIERSAVLHGDVRSAFVCADACASLSLSLPLFHLCAQVRGQVDRGVPRGRLHSPVVPR